MIQIVSVVSGCVWKWREPPPQETSLEVGTGCLIILRPSGLDPLATKATQATQAPDRIQVQKCLIPHSKFMKALRRGVHHILGTYHSLEGFMSNKHRGSEKQQGLQPTTTKIKSCRYSFCSWSDRTVSNDVGSDLLFQLWKYDNLDCQIKSCIYTKCILYIIQYIYIYSYNSYITIL